MNVEFRTLFHGSDNGNHDSGLFLISRPDEWAQHWRSFPRGDQTAPVDFDRETVVMLGVGMRSVLGHHVTIEEMVFRDDTLVVTATEIRNVGVGFRQVCSPAHAVAVDLGGRPVKRLLLHLLIEPLDDDEDPDQDC